jgi:hypothetical protein
VNAEFFCLNSHLDAAGSLVRYLRQWVDPTVALRVLNFDTEWPTRDEIGRRYTELLHASVKPERQLGIEAVTRLELFSNRVYVRLYWPMRVEGYYWYPGMSEPAFGPYVTEFEQQFHGGGRGLEQFLPALAVRDRMVLVPLGQNAILEGAGASEPAPLPLQRGVIETDFTSAAATEQAFKIVGKELRKELRNELSAYQSFQQSDRLDLDAVSAFLGVSPDLLRHALREESQAQELILRRLRCVVEPPTIVQDVQTRVSLVIDNPSSVDLGELLVHLRGPTTGIEISPEWVPVLLSPESRSSTDFSIVASRVGEFVLEVLFVDAEADEQRDLLPAQQVWITSVSRT